MADEAPQALLQRANRLLGAGRIAEAIQAHEQLLETNPDLPDSWYNLGYLQRRARAFEAALASYQQALDRGIDRPEEVHVNRAAILSEHLERNAEAEAELRKAVAVNPRFAIAWLNLGNLHEDWGDPDQARAAYRQALRAEPGNGRALARIATVDTFQGKAADAIPLLRSALSKPAAAAEDAAEIAFALGNALDAVGDYDEAFAVFHEANRLSRAGMPPGLRYDRARQERLVDGLIAAFPAPVEAAHGDEGEPPIFICGMFRSGSTLAEQLLGRHSRVTPAGELEFIPALVGDDLQPYPQAAASLPGDRIERLRSQYLGQLEAIHPDADLVTDKRPDNFLHIGLIKTLFPGARIVHTRRDSLDNLLSIYFLHFQYTVSYGFDLGDAAHFHSQYRRLMAHWKRLYPEDIHDFDYDAAVAGPRGEIEALLRFCGLEWEEECLAMHAAPHPIRTASVWQVRQPLHARSSGRWRHYERHLGRLREALSDGPGSP